MQNIKETIIWKEGKEQTASKIKLESLRDNFEDRAVIAYQLYTEDETLIDKGSVVIEGDDYANWSGENVNEQIYTIVKKILKLEK